MNFKEWSEKYHPNECEEVLLKMDHAWAAGHINMACEAEKPCAECEKEKKNYPWPPFCKWCGRALHQ